MSRVYGYPRISKPSQRIDRQRENILKLYPEAILYEEVYTGRKIVGRKRFNQLLKVVESGDTIVFDSVSRMSRNADEGTKLYFELFDRGINLVFLKENYINTDVYRNTLQNHIELTNSSVDIILSALNEYLKELAKEQIRIAFEQSEKEVEDLRVRTREGIREARKRGKQIGQKKGATYNIKKKEKAMKDIQKYSRSFQGSLTDVETMKLVGISDKTYYKYKKELTEKLIAEQDI